jgi:hypothetical protein
VPSLNMASNSALAMVSRSGANRRGRQVTGGPGVVRIWWTVLWRTSRWTPVGRMKSGNSEKGVSTEDPPLMTFTLEVRELAAWTGADNEVTASSKRLLLQSTRRLKWERKSAPMRGCVTSATTNRHVSSRRNPRLRLRGSHPQLRVVVPLPAQRSYLTRSLRCGINLRGTRRGPSPCRTGTFS